MAKRKTGKTIELSNTPKSISSEQLKNLQQLVSTYNQGKLRLGSMELDRSNLVDNMRFVNDEMLKLQEVFVKEYGTADINMSDGTINYTDE